MRFRNNYLTKLLQKTLLRCDVKSSKILKSFSQEIFFCSGLRNTRSLAGRGDRYQHQDNQMVSLVLLNNTKWYPPMYRPTNCRPGFYMSAAIEQRGRHYRYKYQWFKTGKFFHSNHSIPSCTYFNSSLAIKEMEKIVRKPGFLDKISIFDVLVFDKAVAAFAFCWLGRLQATLLAESLRSFPTYLGRSKETVRRVTASSPSGWSRERENRAKRSFPLGQFALSSPAELILDWLKRDCSQSIDSGAEKSF